ncbi:MAG TPA: energy-coupling factor transporter transmembrane component T [Vicinamibacterales bacterium]|nr:energy-coupling factor transporter transmembrane component T [Vicinamibacterales bacterium]
MSARRVPAIGVPGRLACLAAVILAALGTPGPRTWLALALAGALAWGCHRAAFAVLRARYPWVMVALMVLPAALFWEGPRYAIGPVSVSAHGVVLGAQMSARALAILIALAGFAATVPVTAVATLMDRAGLAGMGFALGVAVNMLPTVQASAITTWQAFRQRGGLRRRWLRSLRLILVTIVSESLRRAEDLVAAAHARGFGAGRRPAPLARGRLDLPVAAVLALVVAAIWFA